MQLFSLPSIRNQNPRFPDGRELPFVGSVHQSFERLQDSKTRPTAYACNSALAAGGVGSIE